MSRQQPKVDKETVDMMTGAIYQSLYGPGGMAFRLPPEERQMLADTEILVKDRPSPRDIAMVAKDVGDNGVLLGLFTHPPSKIQVFASSVIQTGYDPVDVATHELGHRFSYDHSLRPATVGMVGHNEGHAEARVLVSGDSCPVCLLHARTAEVVMLMDGLKQRAHLQHQIPLGLGGTIPLAARKTAEARSTLAIVAPQFADRSGQVRELDGMLASLQLQLSQHMTPEDVSAAYRTAYQAWDRAYDFNHVYWLQQLYGPAVDMHGPIPTSGE